MTQASCSLNNTKPDDPVANPSTWKKIRKERMTGAELKQFFDQLFPHGFAGADVVREIAPEQWEKSPLLACFHPSPQQILQERLLMHWRIEALRDADQKHDSTEPEVPPRPTPTMEELLTARAGKMARSPWADQHSLGCRHHQHDSDLCLQTTSLAKTLLCSPNKYTSISKQGRSVLCVLVGRHDHSHTE